MSDQELEFNVVAPQKLEWRDLRAIGEGAAREFFERAFPKVAHHHFKLPNNAWGRFMWFLMKRYLNRDAYQARKRGRHPRFKGAARGYYHDLPLEDAKSFVVYLDAKRVKP